MGRRLPITRPALTGNLRQTWPGKRWWQKPGPWCRTKGRLGRRGAMLLTLGITYVLLGYREALMTAPEIPGAFLFHAPTWVRAGLWVLTGLVAIVYAARRSDTLGWLALYAMPVLTMLSYGGSFLLWLILDVIVVQLPPLPLHGDPLAWTNALLRVPFVVVVLICSGWLENPRRDCE